MYTCNYKYKKGSNKDSKCVNNIIKGDYCDKHIPCKHDILLKSCEKCKETKTYKSIYMQKTINILEYFNIKYELEYRIEGQNRFSYDIYLKYEGRNYLIEVDGEQHFERNSFFHKTKRDFEQQQYRDLKKTKLAINNGYIICRIAYSDINNIKEHILHILNTKDTFYFSDDNKYNYLFE